MISQGKVKHIEEVIKDILDEDVKNYIFDFNKVMEKIKKRRLGHKS